MSNNDDDQNKKSATKNNLMIILIYALAFAAALGLNDLIMTIFKKWSHGSQILSKTIYVVLMLVAALALAYYTHTTVVLG